MISEIRYQKYEIRNCRAPTGRQGFLAQLCYQRLVPSGPKLSFSFEVHCPEPEFIIKLILISNFSDHSSQIVLCSCYGPVGVRRW